MNPLFNDAYLDVIIIVSLIITFISAGVYAHRKNKVRDAERADSLLIRREQFDVFIKVCEKNTADLMALTLESIKAQTSTAEAIESLDKNVSILANEFISQQKVVSRKPRSAAAKSDLAPKRIKK